MWLPRLSDHPVVYYRTALLPPLCVTVGVQRSSWICSSPSFCSRPSPFYLAAGWGQRPQTEAQSPALGPVVVLGSNHTGMCLVNISKVQIHCRRQPCPWLLCSLNLFFVRSSASCSCPLGPCPWPAFLGVGRAALRLSGAPWSRLPGAWAGQLGGCHLM